MNCAKMIIESQTQNTLCKRARITRSLIINLDHHRASHARSFI